MEIPHDRGLEDIRTRTSGCHAIADALLGAVGESDIGHHFPNTDETIRGISSLEILQRVTALLGEIHARPINVDATLIAEAPKIAPHIPEMRERIAGALRLEIAREHQGNNQRRFGRDRPRRGMAAMAVATVEME